MLLRLSRATARHAVRYAVLSASASTRVPFSQHASSNLLPTYDVVVVGGGVAGSILACSIGACS